MIIACICTIKSLIRDPKLLKYVLPYYRSLLPGHAPLGDKQPYIGYKAYYWLKNYLKSNMLVFEYGSGGSTIFFAQRTKKVISIEHDKDWYKKVSCALENNNIVNCEYFLHVPKKIDSKAVPPYEVNSYTSALPALWDMSFEEYVRSIDKYPDRSFDLVFIDGRSRSSCISSAINKICYGGYLMLDNSEREEYADAIGILKKYERTDFWATAPYCVASQWQTSIWKII